ncbi:MAG: AcrR family transcriptional regulator [Candidatus Azotimanducaceae bacterium]|jgi:AcrR family transcriptional regulator
MNTESEKRSRKSSLSKHQSRLEEILNEGSRLLNENEIGSIKLADVAATMGTTRNALYYYIKNRNDLVAQCYLRSCDKTSQYLAQVVKTTDDPSKQLRSFIEMSLIGDSDEIAILNNVESLPESDRELISRKLHSNINALSQIIEEGQQSKLLKTVNANLVTHMIISVIDYTIQMCKEDSTSDASFQKIRTDNAKPFANFLMNGLAKKLDENFNFPQYLESELLSNFNPFKASDSKEQKRRELINSASLLFNQKGVLGASISDIGANLGVTKGAIYHHFEDKEELILSCYTRAFDIYDAIIETGVRSSKKGMEQLMTIFHLNCQAQAAKAPPMIVPPGSYSLPNSLQDRSDAIRQAVNRMISLAESQGEKRPGAYGSTIGAHFFIQKWLAENSNVTGYQIANEMTKVIATGLCI